MGRGSATSLNEGDLGGAARRLQPVLRCWTKSPLLLPRLAADAPESHQRTRISASPVVPRSTRRPGAPPSPHTPNPRARLEAVAELNRAGIPTGVLMRAADAPGSTTPRTKVEPLLQGAIGRGRDEHRWYGAATCAARSKDIFMDWLHAPAPGSGRALRTAVSARRLGAPPRNASACLRWCAGAVQGRAGASSAPRRHPPSRRTFVSLPHGSNPVLSWTPV